MRAISALGRKGQVEGIAPAIIALMIAGVFLILGLVILQSLRDTDIISASESATVINETLTTVTESGEILLGNNQLGRSNFGVVVATNATRGVIPTTNYTVNSATGLVSFTSGAGINNTNWNVTYTFTYGDEAYRAGNLTLVGIGNFSDFWEIIVLAIVISVVIGLLLLVFGGRRAR